MNNDQCFGLASGKMNLHLVVNCLIVNPLNNVMFKKYCKQLQA